MAQKTLHRSSKNTVIAGVCGGLGEYFDIDPVLFRLLFVAVTLLGGSGVLIYIILWLVIPEDTSKAKDTDDTLKENASDMRRTGERLVKEANTDKGRLWIGLIIVLIGLFFLLDNFISIKQFFLPSIVILAGLIVIIKGIR